MMHVVQIFFDSYFNQLFYKAFV